MNTYFQIGKLAASHGLHGDLILQHNLGKGTTLPGVETIFIEKGKDNFFPFFIVKAAKRSANELLIKLEEVDTLEKARKLTPKPVWVTKEDFERLVKKSTPISLLGYQLIDGGVRRGEIVEIMEQPHQLLCTLIINNKEVLVPVHDDNLLKVDDRKREVHVTLPDGLLEIYL